MWCKILFCHKFITTPALIRVILHMLSHSCNGIGVCGTYWGVCSCAMPTSVPVSCCLFVTSHWHWYFDFASTTVSQVSCNYISKYLLWRNCMHLSGTKSCFFWLTHVQAFIFGSQCRLYQWNLFKGTLRKSLSAFCSEYNCVAFLRACWCLFRSKTCLLPKSSWMEMEYLFQPLIRNLWHNCTINFIAAVGHAWKILSNNCLQGIHPTDYTSFTTHLTSFLCLNLGKCFDTSELQGGACLPWKRPPRSCCCPLLLVLQAWSFPSWFVWPEFANIHRKFTRWGEKEHLFHSFHYSVPISPRAELGC